MPGTSTVTSVPAGITNCAGTCTSNFNYNAVVALNASAAVAWAGDCSGCGTAASCNVTMSTTRACSFQ